jgi:hypothetical protein
MMQLKFDPRADAASVLLGPPIIPGGNHHKEQIDEDRLIRYNDDDGSILEYEFLNVRRFGVRLDDLEHRQELAALFKEAGIQERDWGHPIPTKVTHRRDRAAG